MQDGYVKPVKGDGYCLFRAFPYVITGSEEHHAVICRWVCENKSLYKEKRERFSGQQNYLSLFKMLNSRVWGTDIDILVVGSMLDADLYTYS